MSESRQHEYLNIGGVVDRSTKPDCMRLTTSKKKNHDPYAIYDDENAGTHYFLVPATKDPRNFTRAFQELNNMPKSKTNLHAKLLHTDAHNIDTSTSGYINDRNFRNISTSSTPPRRSRTKSCGSSSSSSSRLNKIPPPPTTPISSQNTFPDFSTRTEDDYIFLKADTKSTVQPPKSNQLLKREHFPEFAKILKKESMVHYSSSGTTNTNCETECLKKKKDSIDTCTCSIKYKYTGNNDDRECIEPCSCQNTTTKSIVGRYFCMGLRAMFFPCISCYVPAKTACCGSNRKWKYKHSQDDTYVCYQSNNNKPL